MPDKLNIKYFLEPVDLNKLSNDSGYKDGQIGKFIDVFDEYFPDFSEADVILVGCNEDRGEVINNGGYHAPDLIRSEFYQLYYWHTDVKLADAGNIRVGASLNDTYAALKTVIMELTSIGKTVVILGGSHDLTLSQYYASVDRKKVIEATCVDALIDLDIDP